MAAKRYDHKAVEVKWQKKWEADGIYSPDLRDFKKKFYNLWMFPYPSGEGLHAGHAFASTGSDVFGRFKRMHGFNVFQPIGYDSFGIHSENFALKINDHPAKMIARTTKNYEHQMRSLGHAYDWTRTVTTSDIDYYRWTQWLFVKMFKAGLAYKKKAEVNWCPSCKTVLADEQVVTPAVAGKEPKNANGEVVETIDGMQVCERCGTLAERKELKQWFFRITDYADRLLEGLEKINWPEKIKIAQRNWIGKSEGAQISFKINVNGRVDAIKVFTTRPDTLYGATFIVVSPSYAETYLSKYIPSDYYELSLKYINSYLDLDNTRQRNNSLSDKEKTGQFSGLTAINPATNKDIPIYISDYVLDEYGTGAIMGVPAHDQRDFAFARKFKLPVVKVIDQKVETYALVIKKSVNENFQKNIKNNNWQIKDYEDFGYSIVVPANENEKFIKFIQSSLNEGAWYVHTDGSKKVVIYKEKVFDLETENEEAKDYARSLSIPEAQIDWDKEGNYLFCHDKNGKLVNSTGWNNLNYPGDYSKIQKDIERKGWGVTKPQYHLRDWLISRQRYWGPPIPMIYCEKCASESKSYFTQNADLKYPAGDEFMNDLVGWYPVSEEDLPVALPDISDFKPEGTGKGPLAKHPEFYKTKCPFCGNEAIRETDVSDTFLDSAWYFLRYPSVGAHKGEKEIQPWSGEITNQWLPVDLYFGGAEHAVLHLMYSRFVWKMLLDGGFLNKKLGDEPFPWFYAHGLMIKDGAKMSKSRGNVVNPDEYIEKYGADTLRLYLMFMGPMDGYPDFRDTGIEGMRKFIERVWSLFEIKEKKAAESKNLTTKEQMTIKKVTEDINQFKYNTAIASLMEYVNAIKEYAGTDQMPLEKYLKTLVLLLAPFTPHLAEEAWQVLGNSDSVHKAFWPEYDPKLVVEEKITIPVQVNGKLRATIEIDKEKEGDEKFVLLQSKDNKLIQKWLDNKTIKREIYIKGRLVNLVI